MSELLVESEKADVLSTGVPSDGVSAGAHADSAPAGSVVSRSSGEARGELSDLEREILAFERKWWRYSGAKEEAARELFDLTSTRYYQLLNALIDTPAAVAHDPVLVKRLRRMRSTRQRSRHARRLADEKA